MAERKIGHLLIGSIVLLFFIGMYANFFISADKIHGLSNSIGADLDGVSNQTFDEYTTIETQLEDDTYNISTFTVRENQFIDTRGTAQDFTISKDTTSSNKSFLVNVMNLLKRPVILSFLISLLVAVGIILFFRFWKPGGI